jgi:hypothetical protein
VDRRFTVAAPASGPPRADPYAALTELEAMKRTLSWRITAPLRAVRTRVDRQPALRRLLDRGSRSG